MTNDNLLISIFQRAVKTLPYYQSLMEEKGVAVKEVVDNDSFRSLVPLLTKEDIFPRFSLKEMSPLGETPEYTSAILSSGTSGVFSFGLVTKGDIEKQKYMVDLMMDNFFQAKEFPPAIINALPMGVSFVSSYPVIPTSVRTDIALKAIQTFGADRQAVVITDPHILKKLLEEGVEAGIVWSDYKISAVIGGTWFSDSFVQYAETLLNQGRGTSDSTKNHIFSTMGVTEVGLNLFTATPDLIALRNIIQAQDSLQLDFFGRKGAVPTLFYAMSPQVYIEVIDRDESGVGDLVVTHLDTEVTPQLIRYKTGDKVKIIDREKLASIGVPLLLDHPVYAMVGRASELSSTNLDQNDIKQLLYSDHNLAKCITGHFEITENTSDKTKVKVQLRAGCQEMPNIKEMDSLSIEFVAYEQFTKDLTVSYEHKWKHSN